MKCFFTFTIINGKNKLIFVRPGIEVDIINFTTYGTPTNRSIEAIIKDVPRGYFKDITGVVVI